YRVIDRDGDITAGSATQEITVTDTVPAVGDPDDRTVREEHLPASSNENRDPTELIKVGSLAITKAADSINTTFDATQEALDILIDVAALTSGGKPVSYTVLPGGHQLIAEADGERVFTVTIPNPADDEPGYEFELHRPLDHNDDVNARAGEIDLTFKFTVTDSDGD